LREASGSFITDPSSGSLRGVELDSGDTAEDDDGGLAAALFGTTVDSCGPGRFNVAIDIDASERSSAMYEPSVSRSIASMSAPSRTAVVGSSSDGLPAAVAGPFFALRGSTGGKDSVSISMSGTVAAGGRFLGIIS
jgi:hypothetical protein